MLNSRLIPMIISIIWIFAGCIYACAETYVVSIGIANYADPKVSDLTKTEKDAKAMARFFKKGGAKVITLTGSYATKSQMLKCLNDQFCRAESDDKIILFFSGHGYPGGFCPYDMTDLNSGVTYKSIIQIMQKSKARIKIIFADACNSGAFRQNKTSTIDNKPNVLLFLSSRGNESSIESPFLANGIFTKHLLRGLRGGADSNGDRMITARELFNHVSNEVIKQTRNRQHPVMWGHFDDNLVIADYTN